MTFSKDLRFRLEYAGFRVLQAAARSLPLEPVSRLSGMAWRLIAPRLYRQERALNNLALAYPEMSLEERKRLAADMWENLGRTFAESFHLERIVAEGRIRFEPEERFDEISRGGPFVICGLHLSNWEILAHTGKRMGVPLTGVYQRLSNPYVDAETRKLRAFLYEGGLLPKTPVTARTLPRARRRREAIRRSSPTCATTVAQGSLLRPSGAVEHLSRRARAHGWSASVCRRRLPPAECTLCHPGRTGAGPAYQRSGGRCDRGDRHSAKTARSLHPGGAGTVDVGAPALGLSPGNCGRPLDPAPWPVPSLIAPCPSPN